MARNPMVRAKTSLSRKILCLALLNLCLLAAMFAIFARSQFRMGAESFLLGPAYDRVLGIASSFTQELETTPESQRGELLARYGDRYAADCYFLDPQGHAIAGPDLQVPLPVLGQMHRLVPPPPRRPGPGMEGGRGLDEGPPEMGRGGRRGGPRDDLDHPDFRPRGGAHLPAESVFLTITDRPKSYWVGARLLVPVRGDPPLRPYFLLLRTRSMVNSHLFFDWRWWLGAPCSILLVTVLCWLPFVRGLTRSIEQMDRVTEQIAKGRFEAQVADERTDELGHLGSQINHMAGRLQSFVKNQKRFLGDIAHELCAPIARIQFALGILEQRTDGANRQDVAVLHEEVQEMSGLVNELLSFSKAGMDSGTAPLTAVGLQSLAQRAATREAAAGGAVQLEIGPELAAMANEGLLLRALSNLLRNAVRYAGEAGPITVMAERRGEEVWITVSDCGPGIPEAELEEVFAPFYRLEAARTREAGGVGLGLAIVRTCIEACKGTVNCRNRKPSGLEVTIRLASAAA